MCGDTSTMMNEQIFNKERTRSFIKHVNSNYLERKKTVMKLPRSTINSLQTCPTSFINRTVDS